MARKDRNRTFRRVAIKLASRTITRYKKPKPAAAKCGDCHKVLQAIPRATHSQMQNMAKTKKRPERPYGGVLCSACMRKVMVAKARA